MSDTDSSVGTTTIRLGVIRHGPSAPSTFQLGKYETLTTTGTPVRSTVNDTLSTPASMPDTTTGGNDRRSGSPSAGTRCHASGPPTVRGTASEPSWKTSTAGSSQVPCPTSVYTAGSRARPSTSGASATRKTVHGPLLATSVYPGCARASLTGRSENAA